MIRARWTAPCAMEITGHAGYAPRGQDIVCAGISTLWGTLEAELAWRQRQGHGRLRQGGGLAFIPAPEREAEIAGIYAAVWRGVLLLSMQYGDYIDAERTW